MGFCQGYVADAHVERYHRRHQYEVQIREEGVMYTRTYEAVAWLRQRGFRHDMNMHGGSLGFTSFYFRRLTSATEFKLIWG